MLGRCTFSGPETNDDPCNRPANQRIQLKDEGFEPGYVCRKHFIELLECGDYDAVCHKGHRKYRLPSGRLQCPDCNREHNERWMERKARNARGV